MKQNYIIIMYGGSFDTNTSDCRKQSPFYDYIRDIFTVGNSMLVLTISFCYSALECMAAYAVNNNLAGAGFCDLNDLFMFIGLKRETAI